MKYVSGWPGYEADEYGNVYYNGVILKPFRRKEKNARTYIYTPYGPKPKSIFVCTAFHGEKPSGAMVLHANDISDDDRPENLRWGTAKDNAVDRVKNLKMFGSNHSNSKLTEDKVKRIKENTEGFTQKQLANLYGVSPCLISQIVRGVAWRHVS